MKAVLILLILETFAGFCACGAVNGWYGTLAEVAVPMFHNLVAAGSEQCENLKKFFGITYDQMQSKNTVPDVQKYLTIDLIAKNETVKMNISTAVEDIINSKNFRSNQNTVILIPGFMEGSEGVMVHTIAKEFLELGNYNILALDGSDLVKYLYFHSTSNIRFMGTKLGELLAGMVKSGVNPSSITIVGHSLGAHIAGIAGKEFQHITGKQLGRITGLDPAGPCFTSEDIVRLSKGDAQYVDIVHTDAGLLGLKDPIGNKDFYPNGGSIQPGCPLDPGCCHSRAWEYYAESVRNSDAFIAKKCDSWQHFKSGNCRKDTSKLGLQSTEGADGSYFFTTSSGPSDYGLGMRGISIK